MSRTYANDIDTDIQQNLELIADTETSVDQYKLAFVNLGQRLAERFISTHKEVLDADITIAVTAEDADFLAKGFIDRFEKISGKKAFLACFWNDHTTESLTGRSIAPPINEYLQPGFEDSSDLVVIKSIISGSCVVRSNILALHDRMKHMSKVHVAAPVMYENAESTLKGEFPLELSSKFDFTWFAKDSERKCDGEVIPGIGGQIYNRLGLNGKPHEMNYMPESVVSRLIAM
ncbi:TPA: hypothetical protein I7702_05840 [Vibrio vulnificus]|nr:hypothetical protein [Vibrio vulnificus]HAS8458433.1 hypothetical protein [Vibrio vulnificus]